MSSNLWALSHLSALVPVLLQPKPQTTERTQRRIPHEGYRVAQGQHGRHGQDGTAHGQAKPSFGFFLSFPGLISFLVTKIMLKMALCFCWFCWSFESHISTFGKKKQLQRWSRRPQFGCFDVLVLSKWQQVMSLH